MDLQTLLAWVLTPGAGIVAWWLIDAAIRYNWPEWVARLADEPKRWVALGLSGVIALGAWWAQIGMLYQPIPSDWRAGMERGVSILFVAFGVSQLTHARARAARMRRIERARMRPRG